MDFISHLPASEQEYIQVLIDDQDLTLNEKLDALKGVIFDENVVEKCRKHLESQRKLSTFLENAPEEQKDIIESIVTDDILNLAQKMTALHLATKDAKFLKESLCLLKNMESLKDDSIKKKDFILEIPAITDFKFLEKVAEIAVREKIKTILLENGLTTIGKMQKIAEIVSKRAELKECRRFLREMDKESQLLAGLPEKHRAEAAAILRENVLSTVEKRKVLRHILKNKGDRKKCREYLKEKALRNPIFPKEGEEADMPSINMDFFEKCPKVMNILILGETGVGKSTFINGVANYLKYRTMHEAKNSKEVEILITSYFTHTDENFQQVKIVCEAEDDEGNENLEDGKSSTLAAMTYVFQWGPPGQEKQIRLIDTPGVGDVAGFEKDKQNFDNIFMHLADYKELHGICVLLKPNESKLNTTFTYCLGELLSRLHISARKNIMFCFTSTRNTLYRPGETMAILSAYIKELERKRNIQIPLNRSSLFCFDNESFRFLCAWKEGVKFSEGHVADFCGSWKRSVEEVFRFFTRVSQHRPHNLAETLAVNNARTVLNIHARPMSNLKKKLQILDKVIQEKWKEIQQLNKEIATLKLKLYHQQLTTTRTKTERLDTVCTSATCATPDEHNVAEKRYKKCHIGCGFACVTAKLETCQEVKLQQCMSIDKTTLKCTACGCLWLTHMQIDYDLTQVYQKVVDPTVQHRIEKLQQEINRICDEIVTAGEEREVTGNLYKKIKGNGDEFASFLVEASILPYNIHKKEYLQKLINEEKQRVGQGKSDKDLNQLEMARDEHDLQVAVLDSCKKKSGKSVAEIEEEIGQLKEEGCEEIQTELEKMVLLKIRSKPMIRSKVVNLNDGWIGDLFQ